MGIAELALLAFDIWMLPLTGRPGGGGRGKPPTIGGGSSGGAAVAGGGVLVAAESIEALRRLVRLGLLTNPGLVKAVIGGASGGPLATPKPMHAEPPKGKASAPDPNARPAEGLPTPAEDALVQEYTRGLAKLIDRHRIRKNIYENENKTVDDRRKAEGGYDAAVNELKAIEERARKHGGDTQKHLQPLLDERAYFERNDEMQFGTGTLIKCDAVSMAPRNLRGKDFTEIDAAMGDRTPTVLATPKPSGGTVAPAHHRLKWTFEDGSTLLVDRPALPKADSTRAASADHAHVELTRRKASAWTRRAFKSRRDPSRPM